jgi:hypothetical protein
MKSAFHQLILSTRRTVWAILVAYMLGIHNFYKGEDKTPDNIVTIEYNELQEGDAPKD